MILHAKIILKNGRTVRSRKFPINKKHKYEYQELIKEGFTSDMRGQIQIGKLVVRFEDISAIWIR